MGIFWYVGYQDKTKKEAAKKQYLEETLGQKKNIEAIAIQELLNGQPTKAKVEINTKLNIASSTNLATTEQLKTYGLDVAEALRPLSNKRENEPKAVVDSVDKNDQTLLKPVTESRILHEAVVQNLKKVSVPKELVTEHQKIITETSVLVVFLKNMENAPSQPSNALKSSQDFITRYPVFLETIDTLNKYFASKGIKFTKEEITPIFISFN